MGYQIVSTYVAPVIHLSHVDVERWYAGKTDPRSAAEKAVWLLLVTNRLDPMAWQASVWRAVTAALNAYEGGNP